jgi:poly-gamma-glutamate synthesis protein (capsule biosynthesis protein)
VAPTNFVEGLTYAGYDIITQGSNHVKDFGSQYVLETIAALDRYGVRHAGAGANVTEAQAALVYETNGVSLAVVSGVNIDVADNSSYWAGADFAGSAPIDEASIAASIAAVREQVDYVIFAPQWGTEYIPGPSPKQAALAEAALAAGADLVVGNHPHVPQWANYNDSRGFVAWALGNFVYDQNWCYWTERSNILEAVFGDGRLLSVRFIPVKVEDMFRPTLATGTDRENMLRLLELGSTGQVANELICATSPLRTVLQPFVR